MSNTTPPQRIDYATVVRNALPAAIADVRAMYARANDTQTPRILNTARQTLMDDFSAHMRAVQYRINAVDRRIVDLRNRQGNTPFLLVHTELVARLLAAYGQHPAGAEAVYNGQPLAL